MFSIALMLGFVIGETAPMGGSSTVPLLDHAALSETLMTPACVRPNLSSKASKLFLSLKSWAHLTVYNGRSYTTQSKSVLFSFCGLVFNKIPPKS